MSVCFVCVSVCALCALCVCALCVCALCLCFVCLCFVCVCVCVSQCVCAGSRAYVCVLARMSFVRSFRSCMRALARSYGLVGVGGCGCRWVGDVGL